MRIKTDLNNGVAHTCRVYELQNEKYHRYGLLNTEEAARVVQNNINMFCYALTDERYAAMIRLFADNSQWHIDRGNMQRCRVFQCVCDCGYEPILFIPVIMSYISSHNRHAMINMWSRIMQLNGGVITDNMRQCVSAFSRMVPAGKREFYRHYNEMNKFIELYV